MNSVIRLSSVTKLYGDTAAVNNLDLSVNEGEILGLIGQNGAGKTTTLKMIVGLLKPTSGDIEVMGYNVVKDSKQARKQTGYLPEESPLYENMTVRQYLHFFAEIYGLSKKYTDNRIDSLLDSLDLSAGNKLTGELSKGMKRKVAVSRTLLHNPSLLVLDEPTSGLDPVTSSSVNGYLKELRLSGKTIVLSAHNLFQIESICDRVAIINNGELYICDTVDSIREKLGHREYEVIFTADARLDYELRDGHYVFRTSDIRQISSMLDRISDQGWTLIDISIQQSQLEEVYVNLIKSIAT